MIYVAMMINRSARSLSAKNQEALRQRAVRAVLEGLSQREAARLFGVARQTVNQWMRQYRAGGAKALKARPQGRPKGWTRLKDWQATRIIGMITNHTPDQLRLPHVLWMRESVGALIEQRFGVRVSPITVGRWLKCWGLTPRKPMRRTWERNPKRVAHWFKVEYPRVRREAYTEGAEIHWGDEQAGPAYERKGRIRSIPGPSRRGRRTMTFSVTGRGKLRFMFFKQRFAAKILIEFMRRLPRSVGRKVYLIVDDHPVHRAAEVAQWLERHKKQIRLILAAGLQSAA